jgi:hypothetical protein
MLTTTNITSMQKKHFFTFKYSPLSLAYARTCHTFQGQNVGPWIIVHPWKKTMELLCPGLYLFISRPAIIGTSNDRFQSALFFGSYDINRNKLATCQKPKNGEEKKKIKTWKMDYNFKETSLQCHGQTKL